MVGDAPNVGEVNPLPVNPVVDAANADSPSLDAPSLDTPSLDTPNFDRSDDRLLPAPLGPGPGATRRPAGDLSGSDARRRIVAEDGGDATGTAEVPAPTAVLVAAPPVGVVPAGVVPAGLDPAGGPLATADPPPTAGPLGNDRSIDCAGKVELA